MGGVVTKEITTVIKRSITTSPELKEVLIFFPITLSFIYQNCIYNCKQASQ